MGREKSLNKADREVKLGFLTRPTAGTGQFPKDKSANTKTKYFTGSY